MGIDQERHRSGLLKQQNKPHKHGRHRSKGAIQLAEKGRTSLKIVTKRFKKGISKDERRNQMIQHRLKKKLEVMQKKRKLGSLEKPPFLIALVPLHFNTDSEKVMRLIKNCCENNNIATSPEGVLHIK